MDVVQKKAQLFKYNNKKKGHRSMINKTHNRMKNKSLIYTI
jgi:hypothetical protein